MPDSKVKKEINIDIEKLHLEKVKAETDKSLQEKRLELEIEKLKLDRDKFAFEQNKIDKTERFINKNVGTVITAIVSLTAVVVSLGQVWVTKISKDREIEVTRENKRYETEVLDKQKNKELELAEMQKKRDWSLNVANFVMNNRKALFYGTDEDKMMFAKIIPTMFPVDISASLLAKLEVSSPAQSKKIWSDAIRKLPILKNSEKVLEPTVEAYLPLLGGVAPSLTHRYVNIIATDIKGKPISGITFIAAGSSEASTDAEGKARLLLGPSIEPGFWYPIAIEKSPPGTNLTILSPRNGFFSIPSFSNVNYVSIVVGEKSGKEAKENSPASSK